MNNKSYPRSPGFTLPAVLVVVSALLLLAIGLLIVVNTERKTARSYVDRQRAELAVGAGLESVKGLLKTETANDDYLVIQSTTANPITAGTSPVPNLFVARGEVKSDALTYRYIPLFSINQPAPANSPSLIKPDVDTLISSDPKEFHDLSTLPYLGKSRVAWVYIKDKPNNDSTAKIIARYAYWVEDMQSRVDAKVAGNTNDPANANKPYRKKYPLTAPGINIEKPTDTNKKLNEIAVYALEPNATNSLATAGDLTQKIIGGRPLMISPESIIASTQLLGNTSTRGADGKLTDALAAKVEENLSTVNKSYKEKAVIPYAEGIDVAMVGKPKLNLNTLLNQNRDDAITKFAAQINSALKFKVGGVFTNFSDGRKGLFPEDYGKTLAASAFDYADADSDPSLKAGQYRGIDSYPLLSEVTLHTRSNGSVNKDGKKYIPIECRLFVEFWNMTSKTVTGNAKVSYENSLIPPPVGAAPVNNTRLDSPAILDDSSVATATPALTKENGLYWTTPVSITLLPDQYKTIEVVKVVYNLEMGSSSPYQLTSLVRSGISTKWNNFFVERTNEMDRKIFQPKVGAGALEASGDPSYPGFNYGTPAGYKNNMGDVRISNYITVPTEFSKYPNNISPHRRNIRRGTIYDPDGPTKEKFYGRVLPSEWPDGGHDSLFGNSFTVVTDSDGADATGRNILPTDANYPAPTDAQVIATRAPQRISNAGVFYSATELGNVFDPIMWKPTFNNDVSTTSFYAGDAKLKEPSYPDVIQKSTPSSEYGGGNTLRIGRPEHPRFDLPGGRASSLLDLFHVGDSTSTVQSEREGPLYTIEGQINLNTASKDAIRAIAAGYLEQDPEIALYAANRNHKTYPFASTSVSTLYGKTDAPGAPTNSIVADRLANAIIKSRPFACAADIATASEGTRSVAASNLQDPGAIFGNRNVYSQGQNIQWTDAAAEELFARVYEASTLRSRNFRVWVIGQAIAPIKQNEIPTKNIEVMSEVRKNFTIFADPGVRTTSGDIDPLIYSTKVIYENDF